MVTLQMVEKIMDGSFTAANPVTVNFATFSVGFPLTVTVIPAAGDTASVEYSANGSLLPVQGLTSVTAATSVTLPSRVASLVFSTVGTGTDLFEICGN